MAVRTTEDAGRLGNHILRDSELTSRLRALPGVESVGLGSSVLLSALQVRGPRP